MKFKSYIKLASLFCLSIIVVACSRVEDNVPLNGFSNVESLVLTSSATSDIVSVSTAINLTLTGDDGVDYTSEATFRVNDATINGSDYVFEAPGTVTIVGSFDGKTSNTLTFNVINDDQRTLLMNTSRAMDDQTVTFTVVDQDGNDVTSSSTIYVNDSEISGNTFSSSTAGEYVVYASYEDAGVTLETASKTVTVYVPKTNVVVEDYTGTWCGFCPRVAGAIEDLFPLTDNISVVAIHQTAGSSPDPFHFDGINVLINEFDAFGFPQARINRSIPWSEPYRAADVMPYAGQPTNMSIGLTSQLNGLELTVDVDVIYKNGSNSGDKLVVYLVENGLVHPQINYYNDDPTSPYYNLGNPITDFVHNEVLRMSLTNVLGDAISGSGPYEVYERSLTATISPEYNTDELEVVVMVVNENNLALNSQHAKVGETKLFQ